jgi:hypothetical protein
MDKVIFLPCPICGRQPKISKKWYTQHQKHCFGASCCFLDLDNSFWDFWSLKELAEVWNRRWHDPNLSLIISKYKELSGVDFLHWFQTNIIKEG